MFSELKDFFSPYIPDKADFASNSDDELLLNNVVFWSDGKSNMPSDHFDLVIIGVPEDRNSEHFGSSNAPDEIRKSLYNLYAPGTIRVVDLGNIKRGKSVNDTYAALADVSYDLLKNEFTLIILGGSKDLIVPVCKAYNKGEKLFSLCAVEPKINISDNKILSSENYLSEIINSDKRLYNYSNIGYQTYYNSVSNINYINSKFESVRLGIARTKLLNNEPFIRDADVFLIDIQSVKKIDAPGVKQSSINGFYGEEICHLARYAGFSDKVSTFALFNVNPEYDTDNQTSDLSAQIIWHFIQSFYERKNEYQPAAVKKFMKYIVNIDSIGESVVFYKSPKTDRWWVEVNYIAKSKERTKLISCNYEDYLNAVKNEIPERWWNFFQKYN